MSRQTQIRRVERLEAESTTTESIGAIMVVPVTKEVVNQGDYSSVKGAFAYMLEHPSAESQVKQKSDETFEEFEARVNRIVETGEEGERESAARAEPPEGQAGGEPCS